MPVSLNFLLRVASCGLTVNATKTTVFMLRYVFTTTISKRIIRLCPRSASPALPGLFQQPFGLYSMSSINWRDFHPNVRRARVPLSGTFQMNDLPPATVLSARPSYTAVDR